MADIVIYCLARIAQSKLSLEASSDYQDLRRIVGHANMLDYLTAKLINLGYEWDTDDIYPNEVAVAESELNPLLEKIVALIRTLAQEKKAWAQYPPKISRTRTVAVTVLLIPQRTLKETTVMVTRIVSMCIHRHIAPKHILPRA
jgi:hypothetical protein